MGHIAAFAVTVPVVGFAWIVIGRAIGAASGQQHSGIIRKVASVTLVGFAAWLVGSAFG